MRNETAQLPGNLAQWVPVILACFVVVIVFVSGMAIAQHQADDQFITTDELQRSLEELQSYSEEAGLLSQYTLSKSAPRPYTQAYANSLKEATDSLVEKLNEHPHANKLDNNVSDTINIAYGLSQQLDALQNQPIEQLGPSKDFTGSFSDISDQLQQLEQQL